MEWQIVLLVILCGLVALMALGLPVAFCFGFVNLVGAYLFWGGQVGLEQLILSVYDSVTSFTLLPVLLFILMGEVMFQSGVAPKMIGAMDQWLGRLPGKLNLIAVAAGALFATLSGSSVASTGMLGSMLMPEMERRGYQRAMSMGSIMAGGNLAILIPPSAIAVLLGALAGISVGKILIGIIVPGLVLTGILGVYVIVRCLLQPSLVPSYDIAPVPLSKRLPDVARYVLPAGFIVFLVSGLIFLGVATPSEAAAAGSMGCFIMAAAYGKLNREVVKKSVIGSLQVAVMVLMIITGSKAFSQILAFTGVTRGLGQLVTGLDLDPFVILVAMQVVLMFLGMFIDAISIIMVTVPIFMPIVHDLGFSPVWFAVIFMLNMELAGITPPFGMILFTMKSVAPPGTTTMEIYQGAFPIVICELSAMILIMVFPQLALWLPGLML